MAISRMQEPQQIQRGLGSLQDPRQNYGLGKLVKKAVRGVKKIVKSPLGKAAIIGGLGMIPFGASGMSAWGRLGGMMKGLGARSMIGQGPLHGTAAGKGWLGNMLGGAKNLWGGLTPGQKLFTGAAAAATALPFFMKGDEEEDVVEESWTNVPSSIADIRNQARNYYRDPASSTLAFMPGKQFVDQNYYAADGGRVGLLNGGEAGQEQIEQMLMAEYVKYKNQGGTLTFEQFVQAVMQAQQEQQMPEGAGMEQPEAVAMAANGGRIGFFDSISGMRQALKDKGYDWIDKADDLTVRQIFNSEKGTWTDSSVWRPGKYQGGPMDDETTFNPYKAMAMYKRPGKQEGGIMETEEASEMIDLGGKEKDYRETGGFVDLGGKERADDVPARLSKNEFVFTADAVRNAGGGDIDKGSEVMQNLMDNLEAGGEVSEDSQGLEGAQAMYDQQQMLQSRIA